MVKHITTPLTYEKVKDLKCGDNVMISGVIYTSRDAAHKRLVEANERGEELPYDVKDTIVYYVGPAPAQPGQVIGSAGPTTSYRMDAYSPTMIRLGQRGMLGKGKRSPEVIAYDDLGAEAVRRLEVEDLPAFVIIDSEGNNLYENGRKAYLESLK